LANYGAGSMLASPSGRNDGTNDRCTSDAAVVVPPWTKGRIQASLLLDAAQAMVALLIAVRSQAALPPLKVYRALNEAGD
jgi:hypothetical protein